MLSPDQIVIKVENVGKRYRSTKTDAVSDISLVIRKGEIYGLLGPNGAGKTTFIKILSGQLHSFTGEVHINGFSVRENLQEIKQIIGIVPQDIALYPKFTVMENLTVFGKLYGLKGAALKSKVNNLIDQFGLTDHIQKKIIQLSGGMKRRVNIIAGLIHDPEVIMLDEPTVGIDVKSKKVILDNLVELNRNGTTVIYTSHQMDEAEAFCTYVGFIDNSRLIQQGTPDEFISRDSSFRNLEDVYLSIIKTQEVF